MRWPCALAPLSQTPSVCLADLMGSLMLFDLSVLANSWGDDGGLLDDEDGQSASGDFYVRRVVLGLEFRVVFFIMLSLCWCVPTLA